MRVTTHCYAVTGLGYSTPWCVNAGFVVGDAVTLVVDTGANLLAAQTIHGYAIAVRPTNEIRVINTEGHFDHIGGNGFFRSLGADVWGHASISRTDAEFQGEIREFNDGTANAIRRARGEANVFFLGTELTNPNLQIIADTTFDLGGCDVEILMTPGHTKGNLSVWIPHDRVLYTGDCLIREYLPNLDAGNPEDWRAWLNSLGRIEALAANIVVTGHGPVSRDGEVGEMIARAKQILEEAILAGASPTAV